MDVYQPGRFSKCSNFGYDNGLQKKADIPFDFKIGVKTDRSAKHYFYQDDIALLVYSNVSLFPVWFNFYLFVGFYSNPC